MTHLHFPKAVVFPIVLFFFCFFFSEVRAADQVVTLNTDNSPGGGGEMDASGKTVNISNMTLKGGDITGLGAPDGGTIYVGRGATVNLDSVTVSDSRARNGGGIFAGADGVVLTRSTLSGNAAESAGGGLHVTGTATVTNCTLAGNFSIGNGGGISTDGGASVTLHYGTVAENQCDSEDLGGVTAAAFI